MKRVSSVIMSIRGMWITYSSTNSRLALEYRFTSMNCLRNAEVIVRVAAVKYVKPPDDPNMFTTGEPDSTIEFKVEEKLRGRDVPQHIVLTVI